MTGPLRLLRHDRALTAVTVLLDVAFHAGPKTGGSVVGGAEVAERLGAARRGIEPVFQALSRAGLLDSVRGPRGGYRLGRRPRDIRLSEVVAAVADGGETSDGAETGAGLANAGFNGPLHAKVVAPLWGEMDAMLRERLEGLTLDDLLKRAAGAGLARPTAEPVNFAI